MEISTPIIKMKEEKTLIETEETGSILYPQIKSISRRSILYLLNDLGDYVEARLNKNRTLYEMFSLLKPQYISKIQNMVYTMHNLNAKIKKIIEVDLVSLREQSQYLEMKIPVYDTKLESIRVYVDQRRVKKEMRERQYHQVYYIPILSQEFKKKYIRARNRCVFAEKKLVETRDIIHSCQKELFENTKLITKANREVQALTAEYTKLEKELLRTDLMLQNLSNEVAYWRHFDSNQSMSVLKRIHSITGAALNNDLFEPLHALDVNNDWIKDFQIKCLEYGEAERLGEKCWNQRSVDFTCSGCSADHQGWPALGEAHFSTLQCATCCQNTCSSITLEERVNQDSRQLNLNQKFQSTSFKSDIFSLMVPSTK